MCNLCGSNYAADFVTDSPGYRHESLPALLLQFPQSYKKLKAAGNIDEFKQQIRYAVMARNHRALKKKDPGHVEISNARAKGIYAFVEFLDFSNTPLNAKAIARAHLSIQSVPIVAFISNISYISKNVSLVFTSGRTDHRWNESLNSKKEDIVNHTEPNAADQDVNASASVNSLEDDEKVKKNYRGHLHIVVGFAAALCTVMVVAFTLYFNNRPTRTETKYEIKTEFDTDTEYEVIDTSENIDTSDTGSTLC